MVKKKKKKQKHNTTKTYTKDYTLGMISHPEPRSDQCAHCLCVAMTSAKFRHVLQRRWECRLRLLRHGQAAAHVVNFEFDHARLLTLHRVDQRDGLRGRRLAIGAQRVARWGVQFERDVFGHGHLELKVGDVNLGRVLREHEKMHDKKNQANDYEDEKKKRCKVMKLKKWQPIIY
jgi:hypothetical protein